MRKISINYFKKNSGMRASSYCMLPPSTDGFFDTIVGTMDNMQMFTDLQAQAAVRDGTAAIEVLVVQQDEDGQIKLLSKEHSRERYQLNIQPSIEESRVIAARDAASFYFQPKLLYWCCD